MTSLCDPDWIQTNDPKLRRFVLYSAELPDQDLKTGGKDKISKRIKKAENPFYRPACQCSSMVIFIPYYCFSN